MGLEAFQRRCQLRVYDLELKHLVGVLLSVKAQAYLIEGANARHEHEYAVWETAKLPEGKILIPGVRREVVPSMPLRP